MKTLQRASIKTTALERIKQPLFMMRLLSILLLTCISMISLGQVITLPPSGGNQKSNVTQWIGLVSVTINYSSPDVHDPAGEDRTGHIWGELVHYGNIDQGYGPSRSAPWRAGANENTTITFSHDVLVQGKSLKAGTYGLFLELAQNGPSTWIFSSNSTSWGSYFYTPSEDVLRVETTLTDAPYTEWLTFGFDDRLQNSALAFLQWEKKRVPMKIEVPDGNALYVKRIRADLNGTTVGFRYQGYVEAAQFCARNKINLEEALAWADSAISQPYYGREIFATLQAKAQVLVAMGRDADADAVMQKAIKHPTATLQDVHQYGRSLMLAGKNEKALEVFKLNRQLHPGDTFTTFVGLARGYTAVGDKKNAIKNWEAAIKNLPADQKANLSFYETELKKLK
jgi:tetratricopeptide (TPR) repeat protein